MKSDVEQLRRDVMDNQQQLHSLHENLTAVVNRLGKLLHTFLPTRHTVRDQTDIHALEFLCVRTSATSSTNKFGDQGSIVCDLWQLSSYKSTVSVSVSFIPLTCCSWSDVIIFIHTDDTQISWPCDPSDTNWLCERLSVCLSVCIDDFCQRG